MRGQRAGGGGMSVEPGERAEALAQELVDQRPVAVQGRAPDAALLDELERDLGTVGGLRGERPGDLLDVAAQSGVKRVGAHAVPFAVHVAGPSAGGDQPATAAAAGTSAGVQSSASPSQRSP